MAWGFESHTLKCVSYAAPSLLGCLRWRCLGGVSRFSACKACGGFGRTCLSFDAPPEALSCALTPWLALSGACLGHAAGNRGRSSQSVRQCGTCASRTRARFRACARVLVQALFALLCTSLHFCNSRPDALFPSPAARFWVALVPELLKHFKCVAEFWRALLNSTQRFAQQAAL